MLAALICLAAGLAGYARGEFQGFDASGRSRDWRDWKGGGHGYEGLLVDNYLTLLAAVHSATGTFHSSAAAWISCRAFAMSFGTPRPLA